jgi:hypothetical protein
MKNIHAPEESCRFGNGIRQVRRSLERSKADRRRNSAYTRCYVLLEVSDADGATALDNS